ncbi:cytochrome c-type biogenesis protein [Arhodomonas sp. AD133]|uniref:cytochrome c-type biogenesis protein n=1 Tax=Arhodomonas sp. AD133 TaxID=3415009 RepID=UPI003EB7C4FF
MKRFVAAMMVAWLLATATAVLAAGTVYEFDTPVERERYTALIHQLRCLVCQGQSIAESNADLAKDLRAKVHELIQAGKGDEAIIDYMTDRYGDFVLYRPPVDARTWLLWFGPFALIVTAAAAMIVAVRRHRARGKPAGLTQAEHERAERLLRGDEPDSGERGE